MDGRQVYMGQSRTFSTDKSKYFSQGKRFTPHWQELLQIVSLAIILLETVIRPQTLAKTYNRPSLNTCLNLLRVHGETLRCPCSTISSRYTVALSTHSTHFMKYVTADSLLKRDTDIRLLISLLIDLRMR